MQYLAFSILCLLGLPIIFVALKFFARDHGVLGETPEKPWSLNRLNDDVLLDIYAALKRSSTTAERKERYWANRPSSLLERLRDIPSCERSPSSIFINTKHLMGPLKALSTTSRRMRHLAAPDVFRSIQIGKDWDWNKALRALDSIALCGTVRDRTKSFTIELYIGDTLWESLRSDRTHMGPGPPRRFPSRLLKVLTSLEKLEKLTLIIPEYHTEIFRKTFEKANATFPGVHTLVLGPHMDWIIAMCPHVETVSTHDWRWLHFNVDGDYKYRHSTDLIKSAGGATTLRHFEMMGWWTLAQLENVHRGMPGLQNLAMPGGRYSDGIQSMLPTLRRFQDITSLSLADVSSLCVGFDPPGCGNVYMGPHGKEMLQRLREEKRSAEELVARMVFAAMPGLKELWVGDQSKAQKTRAVEDGIDDIIWTYAPRPKPYKQSWN